MVKKKTKLIFEDEEGTTTKDMVDDVLLSKGDIFQAKQQDSGEIVSYQVVDKKVERIKEGEDEVVETTYTLKKVK